MCGIYGIALADRAYRVAESILVARRDSIAHRDPDDVGGYLRPGIALDSRRLAILDLSTRGIYR